MSKEHQVTELIESWQQGSGDALHKLSEIVYSELQRQARKHMASERNNHTLQATALVNEAYLRLINAEISCENRSHFFFLASRMMRRVLVDHAKLLQRKKRGSGVKPVTLHESVVHDGESPLDLLDLNKALESLANFDSRKADILELQYFAGLSAKEIAAALGVSSRTVERESKLAKAWIHRELSSI